jgi:hypothetical protein
VERSQIDQYHFGSLIDFLDKGKGFIELLEKEYSQEYS